MSDFSKLSRDSRVYPMDGESKPVDYAVDQAVVHESLLDGTFSRNRSLSTILAFTLFSLFIFIEQKNVLF